MTYRNRGYNSCVTVKSISLSELPKSTRNRKSAIKSSQDWIDTIEAIRADKFEALRIEFSKETLALGKATADRFRRMLRKELERMGRGDLTVSFRGRSANNAPILYLLRGNISQEKTLSAGRTRIR